EIPFARGGASPVVMHSAIVIVAPLQPATVHPRHRSFRPRGVSLRHFRLVAFSFPGWNRPSPRGARDMTRRDDIDPLRVTALDPLLAAAPARLLAGHVRLVCVADRAYHSKAGQQAHWLQRPMIAVSRWRMPLQFRISGRALGLAMAARPAWPLMRSRSCRLL